MLVEFPRSKFSAQHIGVYQDMEDQPGIQPPRTEKELPSDVTSIHSIETQNDSLRATHPERPVPDVDTSWAAYRILLASVLISGLLFAVTLSFGVFQNYYTNTLKFSDRSSWIGVLSVGTPCLGAPLMTRLCQTVRIPLQYYIFVGWILCIGGLVGSAFSKTLEGLIATQGLVYGLGILLSEMPTSIILNTWFVRRRGLAYGVLFGSTDLFGVGWSFLASATLSRHGTTTTFLMFAAICFVITGIAICFLRRRRPSANQDSPTDNAVSSDDVVETAQPPRRYYLRVSFYLLMAANLLLSLAFYLPFIYLPTYTTMLDSSATRGTIVLGVANAAQIVGEITFGMLSDKFDVHLLATLAALVGCLSTFFLWGFANSFGLSIVFALVFGASASGFIALWPRMGTLFGEADASMIYSFMSFGRGLGAIASGPISAALIPDQRVGQSVLSAQHQFRYVIVFVGSCMAASAAVVFTGWLASFWSGKSKGLHGHKGVGTV